MKKILLAVAVVIVFALSACSGGVGEMQIGVAQLKEEEKNMLNLAGFADSSSKMFDYKVNGDIKAVTVNIHTLNKAGSWDVTGSVSINIKDLKNAGRIAITKNEKGYIVALQGNNELQCLYQSLEDVDAPKNAEGIAKTMVWEEEIKNISANVPIPLLMYYEDSMSNGAKISEAIGSAGFFTPSKIVGRQKAQAVTVTFATGII